MDFLFETKSICLLDIYYVLYVTYTLLHYGYVKLWGVGLNIFCASSSNLCFLFTLISLALHLLKHFRISDMPFLPYTTAKDFLCITALSGYPTTPMDPVCTLCSIP